MRRKKKKESLGVSCLPKVDCVFFFRKYGCLIKLIPGCSDGHFIILSFSYNGLISRPVSEYRVGWLLGDYEPTGSNEAREYLRFQKLCKRRKAERGSSW